MIKQDFYDQLRVSDAGKKYLALVESCASRILTHEPGYEIHHIHPTCLGGLNLNENKVKFTVFEHCKAHALLAQAIPCYKTLQPLVKMSYGQVSKISDLEKIELDEMYKWAELREKALHHPKSPEHIKKMSEGAKGKPKTEEQVRKRTLHRIGKITVNNGVDEKFIFPEDLETYLEQGWTKGMTEEHKKVLSQKHIGKSTAQGRKCINKGGKELKILTEELDRYLAEGWKLGRDREIVQKRKESMKGKTNLGKIRITNGKEGKLVSQDELQFYLENGWQKGITKHIYF